MRVTRMAVRLLVLTTLRMNMRPSEDNAQKNVHALPANDQLHLKSSLFHQLLLSAIYLNEFFFVYVL
jgi:hypothetical protein